MIIDLPAKDDQADCLNSKAGVVKEGGHLGVKN